MPHTTRTPVFYDFMKFSLRPQSLVEWVAKAFNLAPLPVVHTQMYALLARMLYDAVALGVFEAIGRGSMTPAEIAARTNLHEGALATLLRVLEASGYLRTRHGGFSLTRMARKWLLADSPDSVRDHLVFMRHQWHWHEHVTRYLRTGEGVRIHEVFQPLDWELYRRGMASTARLAADEVVRKTPLPPHATRLLDVGGAHGLYASRFCHQHPTLEADVLDLPDMVTTAPPHERVRYLAGDALTFPLGENQYDVVFLSQVSHHLTAEQNQRLAQRVANALRPGGCFVVVELLRERAGDEAELSRSLVGFFFGLTSTAGLWSEADIRGWQQHAGLTTLPARSLLTVPGSAVLAARKAAAPRQDTP
jgi:SAM-dependent methyltransferase